MALAFLGSFNVGLCSYEQKIGVLMLKADTAARLLKITSVVDDHHPGRVT